MKKSAHITLLFISLILLAATSCSKDMYTAGMDKIQKGEFEAISTSLEKSTDYEKNYIHMMQIYKFLDNKEEPELLSVFLSDYVESHPEDPFNAYYLYTVALRYKEQQAAPFAHYYFSRILHSYTDVTYQEQSIHFLCLKEILGNSQDLDEKIECYKELINRFSDKINPGEIYFYLGDCYGQAGQWDLAAQSYKKFLSYPDATVPGNSSAREYASDFEAYYNTRVTWSYASLDELIKKISAALRTRKSSEINKYTSKVKFFMSSWEEQEASQEALAMTNIGSFINNSTRVNRELDKISNAQEAYLKTSGWDFRMNTWYFYFRKINFPANPEIHGNWEWAGIYLGDRVFSRSNE